MKKQKKFMFTAKLYVEILVQVWVIIRDFEAVKKTCSHVLSGLKTLSFASTIVTW